MSSAYWSTFISFFPIVMHFIVEFCLIAIAKVSMPTTKRYGESGSPWALSIQQRSPVQIFRIFSGRMEHFRPLPRIQGHVLCKTGHAG